MEDELVDELGAIVEPPEEPAVPIEPAVLVDEEILSRLTRREVEVLSLIGFGLRIKTIADRLGRSKKTIEKFRTSVGMKLACSDRVQLARLAIGAGLAPIGKSVDEGMAIVEAVEPLRAQLNRERREKLREAA